jgi:hypothetical protein
VRLTAVQPAQHSLVFDTALWEIRPLVFLNWAGAGPRPLLFLLAAPGAPRHIAVATKPGEFRRRRRQRRRGLRARGRRAQGRARGRAAEPVLSAAVGASHSRRRRRRCRAGGVRSRAGAGLGDRDCRGRRDERRHPQRSGASTVAAAATARRATGRWPGQLLGSGAAGKGLGF